MYWSEIARNAIKSDFRSSKMAAGSHFVKKIKVVYWSEMARNAIKSDFRLSKMATGSHLWKKKFSIDRKWREMWSKFIFGHPKWGGGGHHNGQSVNHSGIYTVFALGIVMALYIIKLLCDGGGGWWVVWEDSIIMLHTTCKHQAYWRYVIIQSCIFGDLRIKY